MARPLVAARMASRRVAPTVLVLLMTLAPSLAFAQPESSARSWIIWPSGSIAFPTGRFGQKDEAADPPKDGSKTGYSAGLEAGYFLSDFVCVGLNYSMSRFDLDVAATPGFDHTGNTSVWMAQAWGRFFLRGGYEHWRPYLFAGVGLGQPKASIEYDPAVNFGLPALVTDLESTVDMTAAVSGGIGALIPVTQTIAFSFEPRYVSLSSKGTERTDLFTMTDGSQAEVKEDTGGNALKAKSNTNWWELRVGISIFLR